MHIKILLITKLKYNKIHIKEKNCYYSCTLRYYSSQD